MIKNNQTRPVRRAIHWYNVEGQIHNAKVLHRARQAAKVGELGDVISGLNRNPSRGRNTSHLSGPGGADDPTGG